MTRQELKLLREISEKLSNIMWGLFTIAILLMGISIGILTISQRIG